MVAVGHQEEMGLKAEGRKHWLAFPPARRPRAAAMDSFGPLGKEEEGRDLSQLNAETIMTPYMWGNARSVRPWHDKGHAAVCRHTMTATEV